MCHKYVVPSSLLLMYSLLQFFNTEANIKYLQLCKLPDTVTCKLLFYDLLVQNLVCCDGISFWCV